MSNWEMKTLNELGFVGRGKSRHRPRNADILYNGNYPFIQTGDIQKANFYIKEFNQTYNEVGLAQSKLWKNGTMCISIVGANTAETAILGIDACFPDSVIGFVANESVSDVRYIKYYFDTVKLHLKSIAEGTARENLSLEKLLSFKIPTPKVKTQKIIADTLFNYDRLIANNSTRIELLEEALQMFFIKLNYSDTKKYLLFNYVDFVKGVEPGAHNYLDSRIENSIPFLRVGDLSKRSSNVFVPVELVNKSIASSNDVLISLDGTVGIVKIGLTGAYSTGIRKVVSNSILTSSFIYCLLKSDSSQKTIKEHARGSTILHAGSAIKEIKFNMPTISELNYFEKFSTPIFNLIIGLSEQNNKLKEARDILLPRLMNGEIEL